MTVLPASTAERQNVDAPLHNCAITFIYMTSVLRTPSHLLREHQEARERNASWGQKRNCADLAIRSSTIVTQLGHIHATGTTRKIKYISKLTFLRFVGVSRSFSLIFQVDVKILRCLLKRHLSEMAPTKFIDVLRKKSLIATAANLKHEKKNRRDKKRQADGARIEYYDKIISKVQEDAFLSIGSSYVFIVLPGQPMTSVEIWNIVCLLNNRRGFTATVSSFREYDNCDAEELYQKHAYVIDLCNDAQGYDDYGGYTERDDVWYIRMKNTWGYPDNILDRNTVVTEERLVEKLSSEESDTFIECGEYSNAPIAEMTSDCDNEMDARGEDPVARRTASHPPLYMSSHPSITVVEPVAILNKKTQERRTMASFQEAREFVLNNNCWYFVSS